MGHGAYGALVFGTPTPPEWKRDPARNSAWLDVCNDFYTDYPDVRVRPTYDTDTHCSGVTLASSLDGSGGLVRLATFEVAPEHRQAWATFAAFAAARGFVLPEPELLFIVAYD